MDKGNRRKKNSAGALYAHYREKLGLPKLSKQEIDSARVNLEAIARAICEQVWKKKFY